MPPNEECPNCHQIVEDWHIEWYKIEAPLLFQGALAMDCPLCGQSVGFEHGKIGPAPTGGSAGETVRGQGGAAGSVRSAVRGRNAARLSLHRGTAEPVCHYWSAEEVQEADRNEQAKTQAP